MLGIREAVVALAVEALVVKLDGPGLGGGELEAAQQSRREPRCAPDGAPLVGGQLAGLPEDEASTATLPRSCRRAAQRRRSMSV